MLPAGGELEKLVKPPTRPPEPGSSVGSSARRLGTQRPPPGTEAMTVAQEKDSNFATGRTLLLCSGPDPGRPGTGRGEGREGTMPQRPSVFRSHLLWGTPGKGFEFETEV